MNRARFVAVVISPRIVVLSLLSVSKRLVNICLSYWIKQQNVLTKDCYFSFDRFFFLKEATPS